MGSSADRAFPIGALIVFAVILAAAGSVTASVNTVYWTDRNGGTVSATQVADGSTTVVASGFARPQDVDLDSTAGVLYIAVWGPVGAPGGQGTINRVNIDGTGLATVLTTGDAVHQLALDPATNRIYFTRAVSYDEREISHVTTSGTNYTVLASSAVAPFGWFQSGIALDTARNLLYWGDIGVINNPPNGSVNVMGTDGSAPTQLTPHVDGRGRGFALDPASRTIFLTAHDPLSPTTGGALYSYDIVAGTETLLINDPTTGYWDIEIDPYQRRIWWADAGRGEIRSAMFDGTDVVVELSGLTNPYGIALALEVDAIPTLSEMGVVVLALLLLTAGMWTFRTRMRVA